jgi:ubiquinone biosynthesis protein COQ9
MRHSSSLLSLLALSSFSLSEGFHSAHFQARLSPRCASVAPDSSSQDDTAMTTRRRAIQSVTMGSLAFLMTGADSNALDLDAFMNSELEADQKNCNPKTDSKCIPVLSADEALCKYGQSGNARGEACMRVKAAKAAGGALPKAGK